MQVSPPELILGFRPWSVTDINPLFPQLSCLNVSEYMAETFWQQSNTLSSFPLLCTANSSRSCQVLMTIIILFLLSGKRYGSLSLVADDV